MIPMMYMLMSIGRVRRHLGVVADRAICLLSIVNHFTKKAVASHIFLLINLQLGQICEF
jgi:hypothetical protein